MGAAHSNEPRSVSMDNPTSVIDISDEVVQRLKKGLTKQADESEAASAKAAPPPPPKQESKKVETKPPILPNYTYEPTPDATPYYSNSPMYTHATQTITAAEIRRQKEVELQRNDEIWKERMMALERTLKKTNKVLEEEYEEAVDAVKSRFHTVSPIHQLPPCQDLKSDVIACYRSNPSETLKCYEEVMKFQHCVNIARVRKLDSSYENQLVDLSNSEDSKGGPIKAA